MFWRLGKDYGLVLAIIPPKLVPVTTVSPAMFRTRERDSGHGRHKTFVRRIFRNNFSMLIKRNQRPCLRFDFLWTPGRYPRIPGPKVMHRIEIVRRITIMVRAWKKSRDDRR